MALHYCLRCVILHNILMWYDGRYVQPEDDEHYGKARLSARKRTLLVALRPIAPTARSRWATMDPYLRRQVPPILSLDVDDRTTLSTGETRMTSS